MTRVHIQRLPPLSTCKHRNKQQRLLKTYSHNRDSYYIFLRLRIYATEIRNATENSIDVSATHSMVRVLVGPWLKCCVPVAQKSMDFEYFYLAGHSLFAICETSWTAFSLMKRGSFNMPRVPHDSICEATRVRPPLRCLSSSNLLLSNMQGECWRKSSVPQHA